ncbi:MAG: sulfotransferase [Colwellia sp.]|nr:sulfotransferase [Colwellia sp.]
MSLTSQLKNRVLELYLRFINNEKAQQCLHDSINLAKQDLGNIQNNIIPYPELTSGQKDKMVTSERDDIVFITSRFRSGSTLLWNIFRNIEGITSYYEPFNERRWFDKDTRGQHVDATHIGVDDYSREYDGLESLNENYNEDWIRTGLFMDANTWAPEMKSYICELINKANGRPVLQFNRIDFRLPWLKQNFPNAKFIHLYRHPREQWYSFLTDKKLMSKDNVETTYRDAFYLDVWCKDLAKHFPFLDQRQTPHPYQRFYYLWKLSYLYGEQQCHQSLSFEQLTHDPKHTLTELFTLLNIDNKHIEQASSMLKKPNLHKWRQYADDDWFTTLELECEQNLTTFLNITR